MVNSKKHRLWAVLIFTALTFLILAFSPLNNPDRAPYDNARAIKLATEVVNSVASVAPTTEATSTPPSLICIAGFDLNCLSEPLLVYDSKGQWAYYVYNNIYFEYPSAWNIQQGINREELIILPAQESVEGTSLDLLGLMFPSNPIIIENWEQVLRSRQPLWKRTNTKWQQITRLNDEFQGFEWFWKPFNEPDTILEFFLHNEDTQVSVGLLAKIKDDNVASLINNADSVNGIFPNIQHIAESIQFWKPYYNEPTGSNKLP